MGTEDDEYPHTCHEWSYQHDNFPGHHWRCPQCGGDCMWCSDQPY
jgi:hypothetical protein